MRRLRWLVGGTLATAGIYFFTVPSAEYYGGIGAFIAVVGLICFLLAGFSYRPEVDDRRVPWPSCIGAELSEVVPPAEGDHSRDVEGAHDAADFVNGGFYAP